LFFVNNHIIRS